MEEKTMKENLKKAGYINIKKINKYEYILTDVNGKKEIWFKNKNHSSYGIKYKNTYLEFARNI
jgi:hypothetical protein